MRTSRRSSRARSSEQQHRPSPRRRTRRRCARAPGDTYADVLGVGPRRGRRTRPRQELLILFLRCGSPRASAACRSPSCTRARRRSPSTRLCVCSRCPATKRPLRRRSPGGQTDGDIGALAGALRDALRPVDPHGPPGARPGHREGVARRGRRVPARSSPCFRGAPAPMVRSPLARTPSSCRAGGRSTPPDDVTFEAARGAGSPKATAPTSAASSEAAAAGEMKALWLVGGDRDRRRPGP